MTRLSSLIAIALMMLFATPSHAYSAYAHATIARIALLNVTPQTRAEIERLLARSALLDTPTCPARTLEQAAVWPDCLRGLGERFSYSFTWHYQNVDICRPFELPAACRDGNCVSAQIERNAKLLADRDLPMRERVQALAFLAHFVGDLAQPLHGGDRGDLGGNRQRTNYGIVNTPRLNLHRVWDAPLAERAITMRPGLVRRYDAAERAELGGGTVEDWSRQSWEAARGAYAAALDGEPCGTPRDGRFDEAEIASQLEVQRSQVARGGLRLARMLDEALGG